MEILQLCGLAAARRDDGAHCARFALAMQALLLARVEHHDDLTPQFSVHDLTPQSPSSHSSTVLNDLTPQLMT
jgi:hypothetical protein